LPDGSAEGSWDPSNDYSYQGLTTGEAYSVTDNICIYDGDKLIAGIEPDGTEAVFVGRQIEPLPMPGDDPIEPTTPTEPTEPTTPTEPTEPTDPTTPTEPTDPTTPGNLIGDVDLNGEVRIADLVALCKHVVGIVGANLTGQALINADCDDNGEVDANDALTLAKFLVKKIDALPYK
jgi:hypothetical protein